jgi:hypothetical protein
MLPLFQHLVFHYVDIPTLMQLRAIPSLQQTANKTLLSRNPIEIACALYPERVRNWGSGLSFNPHLTLELIERFKYNIDWYDLSSNPCLTPAIIDRYASKLEWSEEDTESASRCVSANPALIGAGVHPLSLSETIALIDRHAEIIDWKVFSEHQKLSIPLIEHYQDRIDWEWLIRGKHFTVEMFERFIEEWDDLLIDAIDELYNTNQLTPELLERYYDKFDESTWYNVSHICLNKFPELLLNHPEWPWDWS